MNEINIPKRANGFIYTIKSVNEAIIKCPTSCYRTQNEVNDCWDLQQAKQLGIVYREGAFECIQVVVNVKNIGNQTNWHIGAEDVILVDNNGFTYKGMILCERCLPPKTSSGNTYILPQTQVDYIQIFPILDIGDEIAKFKVNVGGVWADFLMSDTTNAPFENIQTTTPIILQTSAMDRYMYEEELRNRWIMKRCFTERINKLKTNIYSRFNNSLTESMQVKLDNKIQNDIYTIQLDLQTEPEAALDEIRNEIQKIKDEYNQAVLSQRDIENNRKQIVRRIDALLELTPREFETYIGELFSHLGYTVEVTQYSNDKGIDIIMYKDDIKYGVQCKRYKGTVGSPEIQTFIGALSHANADKGFFVTTGVFSFEAEKMAMQHPIQLVNRIDLSKMILDALNS